LKEEGMKYLTYVLKLVVSACDLHKKETVILLGYSRSALYGDVSEQTSEQANDITMEKLYDSRKIWKILLIDVSTV
jgi:hypothetical protein